MKKTIFTLSLFLAMASTSVFAADQSSTKIVIDNSGPKEDGVIQATMPLDAIQIGLGGGPALSAASAPSGASGASVPGSIATGPDGAPAPVFNTLSAAAKAGVNPMAASAVAVDASAASSSEPETVPYIEQTSWTDTVRDNKDGIIAAALILIGGVAVSWYFSYKERLETQSLMEENNPSNDDDEDA